jgi:energy-coupling factor transporter ATP-binding protein EcfA2
MRITKIELENFRAFYNNYVIDLSTSGKNLLVYGENGSGKSSLYKALKYFLDSHRQNLNFLDFKNIFNPKDEGHIKFSLRVDKKSAEKIITWSHDIKETHEGVILESAKTKGFIDYKKLLETYFLHIDNDRVNIYDLLMSKLLPYSENEISHNTFEFDYEELLKSPKSKQPTELLKNYNDGLSIKLDSIETKANEILKMFDYKISIQFDFAGIKFDGRPKEAEKRIFQKDIWLQVDFFDKSKLAQHHLVLNEAKLSAIAISIFFASILEQPSSDLKVLALDDVLIGLDMSNRMPIIDILEKYFSDYQIFFMTYDKTWFDIIRQKVSDRDWKYIEFFSNANNDFEVPVYADNQNFIERAEYYLSQGDLKSSVVYLRSEFENQLKKFCDKHNLAVKYKLNQRKLTTEDFLQPVMQKMGADVLKNEIELHRTVILNPLSHSTIASIESKEVQKSIEVIKRFIEKLKKIDVEQQVAQKQTSLNVVVAKVNKEIDFEKDILEKVRTITTTSELNDFLFFTVLENIEKLSQNELEKIFDELRFADKLALFDLTTEANLIRIFTKKSWTLEDKKLWCSFVKYLDEQNKIHEPLFRQKLEEKNALKRNLGGYNSEEYWIDCSFLNQLPSKQFLPEADINEDEIPF